MALEHALREVLMDVAEECIRHRLETGSECVVDVAGFPSELRQPRATFVTLNIGGRLRGCIGSLQAARPWVADVAANAQAAAFHDPRFPPLDGREFAALDLHISTLSPPESMEVSSERDLLAQIRPGVDGLIIEDGGRRGTFLPSVWAQIPEKQDFLDHLRAKAGMPRGHWSPGFKALRYTTESWERDATSRRRRGGGT
ncbi:MAG: AmmeMemoRadiSam system protein A [Gammaproteobacteria bacterium]